MTIRELMVELYKYPLDAKVELEVYDANCDGSSEGCGEYSGMVLTEIGEVVFEEDVVILKEVE